MQFQRLTSQLRSGGNGILVGSAGEVDQRMASGETGKRPVLIAFPCFLRYSIVVSAKKIGFWLAAKGDT